MKRLNKVITYYNNQQTEGTYLLIRANGESNLQELRLSYLTTIPNKEEVIARVAHHENNDKKLCKMLLGVLLNKHFTKHTV